MAEKENQPNLYGPEDKVFNVLETDVTMIKADIKSRHDKIDKLTSEIKKLSERLTEVEEARDIVAGAKESGWIPGEIISNEIQDRTAD